MRPSRPLAKHGASAMKDLATRQSTEPDNLRNTDPVNKHPDLKEQRIVRLQQALHQTARARYVPAMDRHAERGMVRQAGHEGGENRQLAQVTLGQEVGRRVEDGRAVKVGRFWQRQRRPCCSQDGPTSVSGHEALGLELLDGGLGGLWEEEDIPVLEAHRDGCSLRRAWIVDDGRNG